MKCVNCGNENKEGTKFCNQCGYQLNSETINNDFNNQNTIINNVEFNSLNNSYNNTTKSINKKKKHTTLLIIIIICLVVVIISTSALILWQINSNKIDNNNVKNNNSINNNKNNINTTNNSSTIDNQNNNNNNIIPNNTNNNNSKDLITKFDNYNIDIDMSMQVSGMDANAKISGTVDEKNQIEYLKMTMNVMGINVISETYSDFKNGITYMSDPITGSWTKESGTTQMIDLNDLLSSFKMMENMETIDDNHFKIKISNDEIKGMLDFTDMDFNDITGDIFAEITTNNGYIEEIKYDFSNLTEEFGKINMDIKISNYNTAENIKIPDSVIENATEY